MTTFERVQVEMLKARAVKQAIRNARDTVMACLREGGDANSVLFTFDMLTDEWSDEEARHTKQLTKMTSAELG